ncbi:XRE family transcriptional regulator [Lichenibacterium minor]|uniref:XRE family transcriptional regulator n=2 Tax=Lichenibacterium minor TaxID=2316528 RepID=A0A4Q2U8R3_9HYPH|nr:XRE family transcriptional regulator [Lichenibacterium minor]
MRVPRMPKDATGGSPSAKPERIRRTGRNPEFEAALGARIRALRVAARVSQGTIGEAIGISFQQVQKYESGKDRVTASTLQAIAVVLGVHPGAFFDDEVSVLPSSRVADVREVVKMGQRIQRVRNPTVMKHLLSLADLLADPDGEQPATPDGTP